MAQRPDLKAEFLAQNDFSTLIEIEKGFQALFKFYASHAVEDARPDEQDADMLLFQWGRYDWRLGGGPHFLVSLTRQIVFPDEEEQDIWQLALVYRFDPETPVEDRGEIWWSTKADLASFKKQVLQSNAFRAVEGLTPTRVELDWQMQ